MRPAPTPVAAPATPRSRDAPPAEDEKAGADLEAVEDLAVQAALDSQQQRTSDALGELYERHNPTVWRYVYARVGASGDLTDDIASEVWLRVARSIKRYRTDGPGTFTRWLFTIAHHLTVDHHRGRARSRLELSGDMLVEPQLTSTGRHGRNLNDAVISTLPGPDEAAERRVTAELVAALVNRLTLRQREVLVHRFWHGCTAPETAAILGISVGAVTQLQFRGIEKMRRNLPGSGITDHAR